MQRALTASVGQIHGDKEERPFSGLTSYVTVWRKGARKVDIRSAPLHRALTASVDRATEIRRSALSVA